MDSFHAYFQAKGLGLLLGVSGQYNDYKAVPWRAGGVAAEVRLAASQLRGFSLYAFFFGRTVPPAIRPAVPYAFDFNPALALGHLSSTSQFQHLGRPHLSTYYYLHRMDVAAT